MRWRYNLRMASRRALTALLLALSAFAVSAQEFGRGTGAEIVGTTKGPARLSGSLSLSTGPGYGLTAGGTILEDRLWFFGSASQQTSTTRFADLELPENATTSAIGGRLNGQLADRHDFSAYFETARRPEFATTSNASFLSLRYTGAVSSNMFFNASITRNSRQVPGAGIWPAE